jgi:hypothetical protein
VKSTVDRIGLTFRVVPIIDLSTVSGPVGNQSILFKKYINDINTYPTQDLRRSGVQEDETEVLLSVPWARVQFCPYSQLPLKGWAPA